MRHPGGMPAAPAPRAPEPSVVPPAALREWAATARTVTVLTGAGMSAESGVPTFRDAQVGLWEEFDPMTLATPGGWRDDPELVWAWYLWRHHLVARVQPHAGHRALAEWSRRAEVLVATQNVDDLHERAGSQVLTHLHGSLFAFRCDTCGEPYTEPLPVCDVDGEPPLRLPPPPCPRGDGRIRPGVVWFEEMLPPGAFELAEEACFRADMVLVVGTSGLVYPAAVLPDLARGAGIPVVEINPAATELTPRVDVSWRVTAAVGLPALLAALPAPPTGDPGTDGAGSGRVRLGP